MEDSSDERVAAKRRTTALRMLAGFLIAEGRCASGLVGAIPVLLHRRLSSLPRYLSADDVDGASDPAIAGQPWVSGTMPFCSCSRVWDYAPATSCSCDFGTLIGKAPGF